MAGGVSVTQEAVKGGISCCNTSIQELGSASKKLTRDYQTAGSGGWSDEKYRALGDIVNDCCTALNKPIKDLEDCKQKLDELLKAIQAYESVGI